MTSPAGPPASARPARTGLHPLVAPATIALLTLLAWRHRFIQDDAFISFRYARHWAQGLGPVWNPGERVEGYTNFLWTLLMTVPHALGLDPVGFAHALSLACLAGTLAVTAALARRVTGSAGWALLAVALLGLNYSFSAYGTGGLETALHALLVTAAIAVAAGILEAPRLEPRRFAALSLLAALALLTRLDSAVILAAPAAGALVRARRGAPGEPRARSALLLAVPAALIVGGWLAWKLAYYGDLLPNTFYAKAPAAQVARRGLRYLHEFALRYGFYAAAAVTLIAAPRIAGRGVVRLLAAPIAAWCVYLVVVGGDFMEFRLLVPVLPASFVLLAAALAALRRPAVATALSIGLAAASALHAARFAGVAGIESVRGLESHVLGRDRWRAMGEALGELFAGAGDSVVIATTAAGAIPYYSKLRCVDMLGLCDPWVARHGAPVGARSGHRRVATHAYLHRRGVDLVIGLPVIPPGAPRRERYGLADLADFDLFEIEPRRLAAARVIEIPAAGGFTIAALDLARRPAVERRVGERRLVTRPVDLGGPRSALHLLESARPVVAQQP